MVAAKGKGDVPTESDDQRSTHGALACPMEDGRHTRRDAPYAGTAAKVDFGHSLDSRTHRYGVYFDHRSVRFYIDGKERMVRAVEDALASGRTWPFGQPMFVVLNVAVGGREDPSATAFPKGMTVGSVQIWRGGTPF